MRWRAVTTAAMLLLTTACAQSDGGLARLPPDHGLLDIRVDEAGEPVPARVALSNSAGVHLVPGDALRLFGECIDRTRAATPQEVTASGRTEFVHAASGQRQFYVDRDLEVAVPAGTYTLHVTRGPEVRRAERTVEVRAGERAIVAVSLDRWVDMAAEGWVSGDTHLHLGRPDRAHDTAIAAWLRAEDLHVGSLLQWGNAAGFLNSVQASFEPVTTGSTVAPTTLLPGQESPRTEFTGHMIGLGAKAPVHLPDDYFNPTRAAAEMRRQGGLVGLGHAGEWGGDAAIALLATWDLLDFVEVFTFRTPDYQYWYETLNAGRRVAPTAGSDFPCGGGGVPPGTPRVYASVRGDATARGWLQAVRAGRTFVTNGPMVELEVGGAAPGDTVALAGPERVPVRIVVRFDPEQDSVRAVDLLRDGAVVEVFDAPAEPGLFVISTRVAVEEAAWIAVRTFGRKRGLLAQWSNAFAHTAPVYVEVEGRPAATDTERARDVRRLWRARLTELFDRLSDPVNHAAMAGTGKDRAVPERFAAHAIGLLRELQRTLEHAGLER